MNQITLPAGSIPNTAMTEGEVKSLLANAPEKADQVIQLNKDYRRTTLAIGGLLVLLTSVFLGSLLLIIKQWEPQASFSLIDRETREVFPAISAKDAPKYFAVGTSKQYLTMLVERCEQYFYHTAKKESARCAIMLSADQRLNYQAYFDYTNETSPQRKFHYEGFAEVSNLSFDKGGDGREGAEIWRVYFDKTEKDKNGVVCRPWLLRVQFRWRPDMPMDEETRLYNNAGFQAFSYVSEEDKGRRACKS